MMISKFKEYLNVPCLLFFFSLIAGWPCVFYLIGILPNYQISYIVILFSLVLYTILNEYKFRIESKLYTFVMIQMFIWIILSLFHADTSYITRCFYLVIVLLFLNLNTYTRKNLFARLFVYWITIQVIFSAIGFVLFLSGVIEPISTFQEMDGRIGYNFGLFTTNTVLGNSLIRVAGYYDEPGSLATWGICALLFNKLFIKNTWIECILIIGLLFTLSLAYFIQLFIYLLMFYKKHRIKLLFALTFIGIVIIFLTSYNDELYQAIIGRFEYDTTTGQMVGDNRSSLMEVAFTIFLDSPFIGVGASMLQSPEYLYRYGFIGANIFSLFAADGILGQFFVYFPFIYFFFKYKNKEFRYAIIIILIGFLQRPFDSATLIYPLLFFVFLQSFLRMNKSINN